MGIALTPNAATDDWIHHLPDALSDEDKQDLQQIAQIRHYKTGDVIYSSQYPLGEQCLVICGVANLVFEHKRRGQKTEQKFSIRQGDWFGDQPKLEGQWRVRAKSSCVVAVWKSKEWRSLHSPAMDEHWNKVRRSYQAYDPGQPYPVPEYPSLHHPNSAVACITLVTQLFKTPLTPEQVALQIHEQLPEDVIEGAEGLGLQVQRVEATFEELSSLPSPALLSLHQRWALAYEVEGDRLILADPARNQETAMSVPCEMIEAEWDGIVLLVSLFPKAEKFNLKWFLPAVWRYRQLLIEVLIASLTLQLLGLTAPMITQVIIDKIVVQGSLPTLNVMAVALFAVALFEAGLGCLRTFAYNHTTLKLDLQLSAQLFRHLLQLPLSYFESRRVGDTVARVQELENIRQFLTGTAMTVVLDSIFVVVYLVLLFFYSVKLALISLIVVPFFIALIWFSTPILRDLLNQAFNYSADSQSSLVEVVSGVHSVKAHTAELSVRERWEGLLARYVNKSFQADTFSDMTGHLGNLLTNLSELLILWFGAQLVIQNHLTVGALVAFQMLSERTIGPLLRLSQLWQEFQQVLLSVDRIGDILNAAPEAASATGLVLPRLIGQISVEKAVARYPSRPEPAINGVSFEVRPGMVVALVGRSGSGKSTLPKMIQGFCELERGRILLDGYDIQGADLRSLRKQISIVLQDDFLFNGTVFENITFNQPGIAPEQVIRAAQLAAAHDFISELPKGYRTEIGERGTGLSGGQRQRIALARLFLSDAPILILDEATSALDSNTEQCVLRNLKSVKGDRTVLMITHRFAPLKEADLILVLEKGELVEQGTHAELLAQEGVYWALYQQQQANV